MRVILLTSAALVGFSANSLLTRAALGDGAIDAPSFTLIRLATGALTLLVLLRLRGATARAGDAWMSALALAGYALAFTIAYTRIGAAVGALLLFGAVQVTMTGTGLVRGERPRRLDWIGVALALGGLVALTLPGLTSPDALGATLMLAAGACWGVYSLAGQRAGDPLATTAGNFARATLLAVLALGAFGAFGALSALGGRAHVTPRGVLLATLSGTLASGVGYTLWYAALPALAAWRAALLQLIVPALTALLAAMLLGEAITPRLVIASALIGIGVWITIARTTPITR